MLRFLQRMSTVAKGDPAALHNPYFNLKPGQKDVWSLINETAAAAQQELGKPIVNLGQGFFSYNPPDFALSLVNHALTQPQYNQYAHARGNPNLLELLARVYTKEFGRPVPKEEIQVTTGANEGMFSVFFGFLTTGDEVIVFEPFFDQYIPNIEMCGGVVKYVPLRYPAKLDSATVLGDDWTVDWDALAAAITPRTKMIVINTPHNPIGKVFNTAELTRIGQACIDHNLILLSDEVYENLYYGKLFPRPATLQALPELQHRTLTVGSAGKLFAATGWRVGWVQGPASLIKYVTAAHTRICFLTPAPLQQAVSEAFAAAESNGYFAQTRSDYADKYRLFTKVFDDLGFPYTRADGGYFLLVNMLKLKIPHDYAFPEDIALRGTEDFKLAYWLIKEIGVVGIPPTEFLAPAHRSGNGLEKCLRFAVCKDNAVLEDAVARLAKLKRYI